jgi:phosphatidylinositol alpha-1,6-mannosyltransferase
LLEPYVDKEKISIISPGVDFAQYAAATEQGRQWREQNGIPSSAKVLLTVARLAARKNQTAVIRAVAELKGRFPNLYYLVAGQGTEKEELVKQAAALGVQDRVKFLGSVDDATRVALYGACDLYVMPSVQSGSDVEGFGIAFIEAAAAGRPSVAGIVGGQRDAVIDGATGLVTDGTKQELVTEAIAALLSNPTLANKFGSSAKERAKEFDWDRVVSKTVNRVEALQ